MSEENSSGNGNGQVSSPEFEKPSAANPQMDLQGEVDKARNEYLYLRAEFDNYRKQAIKERSELIKYGSERVLLEVLNILDNIERALETAKNPEQFEALKKGFELIAAEFKSSLARFGVQEVESLGQPFDPAVHEALSSMETDTIKPGHVFAIHKKPYKLHEKVLRHGQVVVAKEKST